MARFRIQLANDLVPGVLVVSLGIVWFSYTIADPELWRHVRFGLDLLGTGWSCQRRSLAAIGLFGAVVMALYSLPQLGCIRVEPYYFAFPAACRLREARTHQARRRIESLSIVRSYFWGRSIRSEVG
jgi:hypothetical protein